MCGEKEPWDSPDYSLDSTGEENNSIDDGDPSDETELGQIIFSTGDIVSQLLRISVAIRHPAPHDQFMSSDHTVFDGKFDINHVRDKFPKAHADVATRLGEANSRRRSYLTYRRTHWEKISYGIDEGEESRTEQQARSTIASSIAGPVDTISGSGLDEDWCSDASSQTSFSSSPDLEGQPRLRIPPIPEKGLDGKEFECPLCFKIIVVPNTRSWE